MSDMKLSYQHDLHSCDIEPCLYVHRDQTDKIKFTSLLYVDDVMFTGTNQKYIRKIFSIHLNAEILLTQMRFS